MVFVFRPFPFPFFALRFTQVLYAFLDGDKTSLVTQILDSGVLYLLTRKPLMLLVGGS